jgi:outer membrane protein OmpA-like peptidoglycan-associated protein
VRRSIRSLALVLVAGGLLTAAATAPAAAQSTATTGTTDVALDQYRPSPFSDRVLRLDGTSVIPWGQFRVGLDLDYALRPLVLVDQAPAISQVGTDGPDHNLIEHAVSGALLASVGLGRSLEAGLVVPLTLFQTGDGAPGVGAPSTMGLGNPQLGLKVHLASLGAVGFGAAALAAIPVGTGTLTHDAGFGGTARAFADYRRGAVGLGLRAGFRYHAERTFYSVALGSELEYAAAGTYRLAARTLALVEIAGATAAKSPFADPKQSPVEAVAGLRHRMGKVWLTVAAGPGFVEGYGSPIFRAVAGVTWANRPPDSDGDGVPDDEDRCPEIPEDRDGFQDADGCPDPDNDSDGIPDVTDKCPDQPEDKDGFEDSDGCPDLDNDRDGIPDSVDKCPGKPETKNGFEDEDGCPDELPPPSDRDGDGILDDDDECPEEAEDKDGFEDADGCPDLDNDKDGIPDATDKCPLQPETINGVDDEDGCPDAGPTSQVRLGKDEIETLQPVFFDTDRSRVRHAFYNLLGQVASLLKAHPEIGRCAVEGHTDDTGPPEWNQKLSALRAQSVIEFLAAKGGVDRKRLVPIGHGEELPWASNQTPEGRARNRRVVFHIEGVDLEGQKKEHDRAERRRHIHRRHAKPNGDAGSPPPAEDKTRPGDQGKSGDKPSSEDKRKPDDRPSDADGKTRSTDKTKPDDKRKPEDKTKADDKSKPDDKTKAADRSAADRSKVDDKTKAANKVTSDAARTDGKTKTPSPTSGTTTPRNGKAPPEEDDGPATDDASAEGSPARPGVRGKQPRSSRRAHNKPDGPPDSPATLRDLLKLPER